MAYKDKFTQSAFVEKISHVAKRAGAKMVYAALILYYTLESDKVALKDKAMIIGALGYLISPLDVIPDAIPIAGLSDDLAKGRQRLPGADRRVGRRYGSHRGCGVGSVCH